MSAPTLADVRSGGQPPGHTKRRNEEHWAGRLYMRRISPYFSWLAIRVGFSPNQLTYLMIVCGLLGAVAVAAGHGLASAIGGAVLIQAYLLLDCSDGEVARVRGRTSATGVYLDRVGAYLCEVALLAALGVRAQGAYASGGYVELGLLAALGAALVKAETDNVIVARAKSGLPTELPGGERALRPESTPLALAREAASLLKFHRIIGAVELSLLVAAAAVVDRLTHGLTATRALTVVVAVVAILQTGLHFVSIVASRRLK